MGGRKTMNTTETTEPQALLTAHAISLRTGRHPSSILAAIQRLEIQPAIPDLPVNYYTEDDMLRIQTSMRKKNHTTDPQA